MKAARLIVTADSARARVRLARLAARGTDEPRRAHAAACSRAMSAPSAESFASTRS